VPKEVRLWVDAICINQDDLEERSLQVAQMGQIYASAGKVVVWLGPADPFSDMALVIIMDFVLRLRDLAAQGGPNPMNYDADDDALWAKIGRPSFTNIEANLINRFFGYHWFARTWVIQEIVLA